MVHTQALLLVAACVASLAPALAQNPATWETAFWSGAKCASENTGTYNGPSKFAKGKKHCAAIPDIGVTQAVDFYAADSSYRFGLHRNSDCSDDPSSFIGNPDEPDCIETNTVGGSVAWSVTRPKRKRSAEESTDVLDERTSMSEDGELLVVRARDFVDSYTLSAVSASGGFAITAVQSCPVKYNNNPPNGWRSNTVCAISASGFAFTSFLAVWHNTGESEEKNGATSTRGLWYENLNTTSEFGTLDAVHPLGPVVDAEGVQWDQYLYNVTEHDSGMLHHLIYEHDASTDRHVLSADQDTTQTGLEAGLGKRQSASTFRAYYAWSNLQHSPFNKRSTSNAEVGHLVEQAWNYGRSNNRGVYCANFSVNGKQIGLGQFSITNGVFSPDFSSC